MGSLGKSYWKYRVNGMFLHACGDPRLLGAAGGCVFHTLASLRILPSLPLPIWPPSICLRHVSTCLHHQIKSKLEDKVCVLSFPFFFNPECSSQNKASVNGRVTDAGGWPPGHRPRGHMKDNSLALHLEMLTHAWRKNTRALQTPPRAAFHPGGRPLGQAAWGRIPSFFFF